MSTAPETTKTVGYYNGNDYALNLVISKYNCTLYLQPGEYLKDKQGRKINDPFFDRYRQLSKEESINPVPVVRVPEPGTRVLLPHDGQSVRSVTEFTHSASGVRVPVIPQPKILKQQQEINKNSVTPMTMEEARRRGLAHRTREVPEDYGITDTDSALPPRRPPPMKFATDVTPTKAAPLPQELLEAAKEDGQAKSPALVAQLAQQANQQLPEPDIASGFANKSIPHAPADAPITSGPAEEVVEEEQAPPPPPRKPKVPVQPAVTAMPEPDLEEPPAEEGREPLPLTPNDKYRCSVCGDPFKFRSDLSRHAANKHRDKYQAIMGNYPPEE